jgi:hypothetical protein
MFGIEVGIGERYVAKENLKTPKYEMAVKVSSRIIYNRIVHSVNFPVTKPLVAPSNRRSVGSRSKIGNMVNRWRVWKGNGQYSNNVLPRIVTTAEAAAEFISVFSGMAPLD